MNPMLSSPAFLEAVGVIWNWLATIFFLAAAYRAYKAWKTMRGSLASALAISCALLAIRSFWLGLMLISINWWSELQWLTRIFFPIFTRPMIFIIAYLLWKALGGGDAH